MNELQELKDQLARLEGKADAIFVSAEKTRKYFKTTLIITVLTIVLPTLGLIFVVPYYLSTVDLSGYGL